MIDKPYDMDSIMNESYLTYAWTDNDLKFFTPEGCKRIIATTCKRRPVDDIEENGTVMDSWITAQVIKFFRVGFSENIQKLNRDKLIFLIHFPGTGLFSRRTTPSTK